MRSLSDPEQLEVLRASESHIPSPAELFLAGDIAEVYVSEPQRLGPNQRLGHSELSSVGIGNHPALWQMLGSPAADPEEIRRRQEIIDWLTAHPDEAFTIGQLSAITGNLPTYQGDFIRAKSEEHHPDDSYRDPWERDDIIDPVKARQAYEAALAATSQLAETLSTTDHAYFAACGQALTQTLDQSGSAMDPDTLEAKIIQTEPLGDEATATANRLGQDAMQVHALPAFARHAQEEGFARVTLTDQATEQSLTGMWNMKFTRSKTDWRGDKTPAQVANDAAITTPTVVLTGNNASGKTFHQEARLFAQLSAQTFGYAPAETAVIKPVQQIVVLERARTDARSGLSAFGSEVRTLARALAKIDDADTTITTLVVSDEGFSTTSPEDQAGLLEATHRWLRKHGSVIVAATHNETYVEMVEAQEPEALFHLPYTQATDQFTDKTKLVPTFKLEAGKDDAHAIDVARRYGLDQNLLQRATDYIGGELDAVELPNRQWRRIQELHPDTRRQRMTKEANIRSLFPFSNFAIADEGQIATFDYNVYENRTFISEFATDMDDGRARRRIIDHFSPNDRRMSQPVYLFSGYGHDDNVRMPYDIDLIRFNLGGKRSLRYDNLISEFLTEGVVATPAEILERQKLFTELQDPTKRQLLVDAIDEVRRAVFWSTGESHNYGWYKNDVLAAPLQTCIKKIKDVGRSRPMVLQFAADLMRWQATDQGNDQLAAMADQLDIIVDLFKYRQRHYESEVRESVLGPESTVLQRQQYLWQLESKVMSVGISLGLEVRDIGPMPTEEQDWNTFLGGHNERRDNEDAVWEFAAQLLDSLSASLEGREATLLEVNFAALAEHVEQLRITAVTLENAERAESFSSIDIPDELRQLFFLADSTPRLTTAIGQLRSIDSVHIQSLANHLEVLLNANFEGCQTGQACWQLMKPRLETLTTGDKRVWGKPNEYLFSGLRYTSGLYRELWRMGALAELAQVLDEQGYRPANLNHAGNIEVVAGRSITAARTEQTPNDFRLAADKQLHILTGANMSGKTFHLKQIMQAQLTAQSTGFVAADSADLPVFDHIVFFDRPGNEEGRDLSAFATEVTQWNRLLKKIDGRRAMVIIDEPFSSTSPRYQAALTFALVEKLMADGHTVVMATHHHQLVDNLSTIYADAVDLAHFEIAEEGETVSFLHAKRSGHAPSDAFAVARTLGGPVMQKILDADEADPA